MLVKEVLTITMQMPLKDIAKLKEVSIAEKVLRELLKEIGCEPLGKGQRGWRYTGNDESILEKSIATDFNEEIAEIKEWINKKDTSTRKTKIKTNDASNDKSKNKSSVEIKNTISVKNEIDSSSEIVSTSSPEIKSDSRKENDMLAEIKALAKGTNKSDSTKVYKGIYFDKDIAHFLDNAKKGNKSEIVNKILRQYLTENELI